MNNEAPRLGWFDLVSINIFWLGLNIRNNAVGAVFMPYLVDLFVRDEVQNTALGAMRTAGLVIALLAQPFFGLLSDRSTSRWGRRRPFIFTGVLLDLVFIAALAVVTGYWQLLVVVLLLQFTSNISHGALQGLIPDLVPEKQRGVASSLKSIFELLPLILVGLMISPLVGAGRFSLAVAVCGALLLLAMLLTMWLVREKPLEAPPEIEMKPAMLRVLGMLAGLAAGAAVGLLAGALLGGLGGLIAWPLAGKQVAWQVAYSLGGVSAMAAAVVAGVWAGLWAVLGKETRQRPSFGWWVVNRLMFMAAITSIQGFAPFFLRYAFGISPEEAAGRTGTLITLVGLFTLASALPAGWLSDRYGQRRMGAIGGGLAAAGVAVLLVTIWTPSMSLIYIAGIILGIATGLFVTVNWALGTRLAPSEQAGRYLGASNLAGAGAGMVGAGIGGPVADLLNATLPGLGYFVVFAGYGVLFLLSIASLAGVRER